MKKRKTDSYPLFVHWYKTLQWILDTTEKYPKSVRFSLVSRIQALSLDNIELIVEAIYTEDRKGFLRQLNLNLEKLRVLFRISYDQQHISVKQYAFIAEQVNEAGRMCGGWLKA